MSFWWILNDVLTWEIVHTVPFVHYMLAALFSEQILELGARIWFCWRGQNAPWDATTKMELYAFTGPTGLGYNCHASIFRTLALKQQKKAAQIKAIF